MPNFHEMDAEDRAIAYWQWAIDINPDIRAHVEENVAPLWSHIEDIRRGNIKILPVDATRPPGFWEEIADGLSKDRSEFDPIKKSSVIKPILDSLRREENKIYPLMRTAFFEKTKDEQVEILKKHEVYGNSFKNPRHICKIQELQDHIMFFDIHDGKETQGLSNQEVWKIVSNLDNQEDKSAILMAGALDKFTERSHGKPAIPTSTLWPVIQNASLNAQNTMLSQNGILYNMIENGGESTISPYLKDEKNRTSRLIILATEQAHFAPIAIARYGDDELLRSLLFDDVQEFNVSLQMDILCAMEKREYPGIKNEKGFINAVLYPRFENTSYEEFTQRVFILNSFVSQLEEKIKKDTPKEMGAHLNEIEGIKVMINEEVARWSAGYNPDLEDDDFDWGPDWDPEVS